jgi:hypothetical protein
MEEHAKRKTDERALRMRYKQEEKGRAFKNEIQTR